MSVVVNDGFENVFFAFELPFFASGTLQELTSTTTALTTTSDTRRDHNL